MPFLSSNNYPSKPVPFQKLPEGILPSENLGDKACLWLDKYVKFSTEWSPRSHESYHEAVGLWVLSTIAARRVSFDFGKTRYTNLYILLVGRTTITSKSSATQIGKSLLENAGLDSILIPDNCTPQRFITEFTEYDDGSNSSGKEHEKGQNKKIRFIGQRGWYYDEFGMLLAGMMSKNGIYTDFRGLLRKFDDTENKYENATIGRGREIIYNPYLSLIGCTTPAELIPLTQTNSGLWGDGFFARFGFVVPPPEFIGEGRFPKGERKIPIGLVKGLKDWNKRLGTPNTNAKNGNNKSMPSLQNLTISDETLDAFYRYLDALTKTCQTFTTQDLDGNYGRFAEKTMRIAALFASLENSPEISIKHWAGATKIVEKWREGLHDLYNNLTCCPVPIHTDNKNRVLRAIEKKCNPTKREITQTTGIPVIDVTSIIDALILEGRIEGKTDKRKTCYRLKASSPHEGERSARV